MMKKVFIVLISIVFVVQPSLVFSKSVAEEEYNMTRIGDRLFFVYDGYLCSADQEMGDIKQIINCENSIITDGEMLYFVLPTMSGIKGRSICCYDTCSGEFTSFKTECVDISPILVDNGRIYYTGDDVVWVYDTNTNQKTQLTHITNSKQYGCKLLGVIENCIYYSKPVDDNIFILEVFGYDLLSNSIISTQYHATHAILYEDCIYFCDSDNLIITDKELKEISCVEFTPDFSKIDSRYSGGDFILKNYYYSSGFRVNLNTAEVETYPQNKEEMFEYADYYYYVYTYENQIYMLERHGNKAFRIDIETNIAKEIDFLKNITKAKMKNTLLWNLLKKNYHFATEDDFVMAKINHTEYPRYPGNTYEMLNYIESKKR